MFMLAGSIRSLCSGTALCAVVVFRNSAVCNFCACNRALCLGTALCAMLMLRDSAVCNVYVSKLYTVLVFRNSAVCGPFVQEQRCVRSLCLGTALCAVLCAQCHAYRGNGLLPLSGLCKHHEHG